MLPLILVLNVCRFSRSGTLLQVEDDQTTERRLPGARCDREMSVSPLYHILS